jgi:SAM-dependent methyltransferase
MSLIESIHGGYVHQRRVRVLSNQLGKLLPQNARGLDVGCGDGLIAYLIMQKRPDVKIKGIDVIVRSRTYIPVEHFEGQSIPYQDGSFDAVIFADVLHHTDEPTALLQEAVRVSRKAIVIKDHIEQGLFARQTLRFMDWVGNARHGVSLPYNYWARQTWLEVFNALDLEVAAWRKDLPLYPWPLSSIFCRSLHFIVRLDKRETITSCLKSSGENL